MRNLQGKVAFVTGGSRGIGAAIVRRLAADGADVAFTYVSASSVGKAGELVAEIQAGGGRALAIQADAADADRCAAPPNERWMSWGRSTLVNNAGVFIAGDLAQASLDDYERTMAVNVRAPFVAVQALQPSMPNGGRIINIGSCCRARRPRRRDDLCRQQVRLARPDARAGARPGTARHHRQWCTRGRSTPT